MIFYFPNYAKLKELRYTNSQLLKKIEELKKEIANLDAKNKNLNSQKFLYEKLAREDLGLIRENEIVIDTKE
ncbi:MAG: septum formation initiator family protein [Candidatus Omnitrophica bacterium]|nr:septum formation initiator family protein [Candidatus Omnitrophota bacterium]